MKTFQKKQMCYNSGRKGYVLLITILVIGAVGIATSVAVILTGIGSAKTGITIERMNQAKAHANTCTETALEKVREDNNFSGSGNLTLTQGSCAYTVYSGTPKTITASGTAGGSVRKVRVVITAYRPTISLSAWQEVAD